MSVTTAELKAIISLQDQMSGQLKAVKSELAGLGTQVQQTNSVAAKGGPSWLSMASAMAAGSIAAQSLQRVFSSLVGQVTSMGKATADFGQSMANIDAMSPAADMAQYGAEIENLAMRLGKDYPLSATEAGKAIEALVKKGTSLKDIAGGAGEAVVKLAAATGGDLVIAAEVVNAALDTFKMTATQTSEATGLMTGAMLSSGMSLNDYKYGLSAAGAVVQSYGGQLEDLTVAMAAMTKAGIEGSDAGTSIKSMYNGLIPTTKTATSLMKELGIITKEGANQFVDANGKMKSYEEISRILWESTKDLTEVQRAYSMELIFGSDGQRAATVAIRNGAQEWGNLTEKVKQFDPGDVAAKRMNSLSGSLKQFGGSAETAGMVLIKNFVPGMKTVVDTGTELINTFLIFTTTEPFKAFVAGAEAQLADVGVALYTAGQDVSNYGAKFKDIGAAGKLFNETTTVIGSALTGLAALFRGDAKGAAEAFLQMFRDMKPLVDTFFIKPLDQAMGKLAEFVAYVVGVDLNPAASGFDKLAASIRGVAKASESTGSMKDFVAILGNLRDILVGAQEWFAGPIGLISSLGVVTGTASKETGLFAGALGKILSVGNTVTTIIAGIVDGINLYLGALGRTMRGMVEFGLAHAKMWQGDVDGARKHLSNMVAIYKENDEAMGEYAARQVKRSVDNGIQLRGTNEDTNRIIAGMTQEHLAGLLRTNQVYFNEQGNLTMRSTGEMAELVTGGMNEQINRLRTGSAEQVEAVKQGQADQVAAVVGGTGEQLAALGATTPEFVEAVRAAGIGATAALDEGLDLGPIAEAGAAEATAAVANEAPAASSAGMSVGDAIGSGLKEGLIVWGGPIGQAAAGLVTGAIKAARAAGIISSPSKKAETDVGEPLGQGVAKGIDNLKGPVQAAMRELVDTALAYGPIAAKIAAVEKEISSIREAADTDALFRGKEMIVIDSESLRLRQVMAEAERRMVPTRQDLARVTREIADIERGMLGERVLAIEVSASQAKNNVKINELERDKLPLQRQSLEIERLLMGVDPEGKKAKALKEEQEAIRKKLGLIDNTISQIRLLTREGELEIASNREMATVASAGAKIRKEELEERARLQEESIGLIKEALEGLDAEKSVFQANEAVIKNATENEINYRRQLIAVFTAEGKPIADRLAAGRELLEQLHNEGKISDELYNAIKRHTDQTAKATTATGNLGKAAETAAPQIDAAAKKAEEMAKQAKAIADASKDAEKDVLGLAKSLGKLPSWFTPKSTSSASNLLGLGKARGGDIYAGQSVLVGEEGPEIVQFGRSGVVLPNDRTEQTLQGMSAYRGNSSAGGGSGGRTETIIVEFRVDDRLAESIYVTGKDLSSRRRTED